VAQELVVLVQALELELGPALGLEPVVGCRASVLDLAQLGQ